MSDFSYHNPLPKDNADSVDKAIAKIRYEPVEHLYIFKKNKQVRRFKGEKDRVTLSEVYLLEMKDAIIVHNHPQGSSFSYEDVQATVHYNAKELIVVTSEYIYKVTKPQDGWFFSFDDELTQQQYEESQTMANDLLNKMIANNELSNNLRDIEKIHYIWSIFFRLNETNYTRKKHI